MRACGAMRVIFANTLPNGWIFHLFLILYVMALGFDICVEGNTISGSATFILTCWCDGM